MTGFISHFLPRFKMGESLKTVGVGEVRNSYPTECKAGYNMIWKAIRVNWPKDN